MENHGILRWRRCSTVRKAQIIAALLGASATVFVYLPLHPAPDTKLSSVLFNLFLLLYVPTFHICELIGIYPGHWWVRPMQVAVNAALCLILGTGIGWGVSKLKAAKRKPSI